MGQGSDDTRRLGPDEVPRTAAITNLRIGVLFAERYLLQKQLGSGGAGIVFRADDTLARTTVAVKVLYRADTKLDTSDDRLRRELLVLRELSHSGIVRVFDVGHTEGLLFLVMECLEGETLGEFLEREKSPPIRWILSILEQQLEALEAAHQAGIIHRDIKPANIFLVPVDGEACPRVVLLDFGLARPMAHSSITLTGQFLGSPAYVSPEQARGERELSPATDLYSLGVVLWEMITGEPPFRSDSLLEILAAHSLKPLPRPRKHLHRAPLKLRRFCQRLLRKNPGQRYEDACEALAQLRAERSFLLPFRRKRSQKLAGGSLPFSYHRRKRLAAGLLAGGIGLLLVLGLLFFPVAARVEENSIVTTSLAGLRVRTTELPWESWQLIPRDTDAIWSRSFLGAIVGAKQTPRRAFPREYPDGLFQFDLLTGKIGRCGETPQNGWREARDDLDDVFFTQFFQPVEGISEELPNAFHITYGHRGTGKISASALMSCGARAHRRTVHEGRTTMFLSSPPGEHQREGFLFYIGPSTALGFRLLLWGNPCEKGLTRFGSTQTPPFSAYRVFSPPFFCTPTSHAGICYDLRQEGRHLIVGKGAGNEHRFDSSTGLPLSVEDRDGLEEEAWLGSRDALMAALWESSGRVEEGDLTNALAPLYKLATREPIATTHLGITLGRIAELLQEAGLPEQALPYAEQAREAEPHIPGHTLRLVELLSRLNRFEEIWPRCFHPEALRSSEFTRPVDLAVSYAALLASRPDLARDAAKRPRARGSYFVPRNIYLDLVIAFHEGHLEQADDLPESHTYMGTYPHLAFLRALVIALRDSDNLDSAREALEIARKGKGLGMALPIEGTAALVTTLEGGTPDMATLETELAQIERRSNDTLQNLYFLSWARAIAARVAWAIGDTGAFERHLADLRRNPGAGPWTELILAPCDVTR